MKKQILRLANTNMYTRSVKTAAVLLLMMGSYSVQAQVAVQEPATEQTVVRHLSNHNGVMTFQILHSNENGDKFSIVLKDKQGDILFQDTYTDKKFDKKFRLQTPENDGLVFYVKNFTTNKVESFEISATTKVIEEVSITRVAR